MRKYTITKINTGWFKKGDLCRNQGRGCFQKGHKINLGKKRPPFSEITKKKMRENQKGEGNSNWKGDEVKYQGLHKWIRTNYGIPSKCEYCGTTKKRMYHWANLSGEYKRDISDWIRVCVPCHKKYIDTGKVL